MRDPGKKLGERDQACGEYNVCEDLLDLPNVVKNFKDLIREDV